MNFITAKEKIAENRSSTKNFIWTTMVKNVLKAQIHNKIFSQSKKCIAGEPIFVHFTTKNECRRRPDIAMVLVPNWICVGAGTLEISSPAIFSIKS